MAPWIIALPIRHLAFQLVVEGDPKMAWRGRSVLT